MSADAYGGTERYSDLAVRTIRDFLHGQRQIVDGPDGRHVSRVRPSVVPALEALKVLEIELAEFRTQTRQLQTQLNAAERECGEAWSQYNDSEAERVRLVRVTELSEALIREYEKRLGIPSFASAVESE